MKTRLVLLLVLLAAVVAVSYLFRSLGHILHHEDPLERADVIFVLSGARISRIAEAGELYREGWAPRILLSRQLIEHAEKLLRARGVAIPTETEIQRQTLTAMGVPADAISVLRQEQVATADEVDAVVSEAASHNWHRIIVVTSRMHTARAALVLRRGFASTDTRVIMRASRYDEADIDRWWSNRADLRFALWESQKLLAYWLGLAD